jgi:hypothetical protein
MTLLFVVPAKAGTHLALRTFNMDSRVRGNDGLEGIERE